MVVQGFGEHELTILGAVVLRRRLQQGGKGNLCTLLSYCERLHGRRIGDYKELMDLAQWRETWRRLAKSLYLSHEKYY